MVPSAGVRNPFETYLYINYVENLKSDLYQYLALEHNLLFLKAIDVVINTFTKLSYERKFVGNCAVIFMWVAIPFQ
jgi:hypothetical protein